MDTYDFAWERPNMEIHGIHIAIAYASSYVVDLRPMYTQNQTWLGI